MEKFEIIIKKVKSIIKRFIRWIIERLKKVFFLAKKHKKITFVIALILLIILLTFSVIKIKEKIENNVDISKSTHAIIVDGDTYFYKNAKESKFGLIDKLSIGEEVYIVDEIEDKEGNSWYKVKSISRDRVGYIKKNSVDFYEMSESSENVLMSDVSKFDIQYGHIKDKSDFEVFLLKQNINYVYIRAGGRGYGEAGNFYYDTEYKSFIEACEYLKIPYGFYYINNAKDDTEIKEEVEFMKDFIEKNSGEYYLLPLVIDLEDFEGEGRLDKLWSKRGDLTQKVVDEFSNNDIDTIVYCNAKLANKYLKNVNAKFWVAYYDQKNAIPTIWYDETNQGKNASSTFKSKIIAWQFTENGIGDDRYKVDMSIVKNVFFKNKVEEAKAKKKAQEEAKTDEEQNLANIIDDNETSENNIENNTIDNTVTNEINNQIEIEDEKQGYMVDIQIGDKVFKATLYDNETNKALIKEFPIIMNMKELNGNEKYYDFTKIFPTKIENVGNIKKGEIMLYGSNCLVLFYDSFATSYSYTKLGYINDITGLKEALGTGDVTVRFSISEN